MKTCGAKICQSGTIVGKAVTEKLNPGDSADEISENSFKNNLQFDVINSPGYPINIMFLR
jgi:hypothetical protein